VAIRLLAGVDHHQGIDIVVGVKVATMDLNLVRAISVSIIL